MTRPTSSRRKKSQKILDISLDALTSTSEINKQTMNEAPSASCEPALGGEKLERIAEYLQGFSVSCPALLAQLATSLSQVVVAEVRRAAPGCSGVALLRMGSLRITIGDRLAAQMEARGSRWNCKSSSRWPPFPKPWPPLR